MAAASNFDSNNNVTIQNSDNDTLSHDLNTSDTVDVEEIVCSESIPGSFQTDLFDDISAATALIYDDGTSSDNHFVSSKQQPDDKLPGCTLPVDNATVNDADTVSLCSELLDSNATLNPDNSDTVSACSEYGSDSSPAERYDRLKNESPVSHHSLDEFYFKWKQCIKCKESFFDFYTTPCSFCHGSICDECFHTCTYLQVIENHINILTVTEGGQLHPYAKLFLVCSEGCETGLWSQLYFD